jgi:hypothetical protein
MSTIEFDPDNPEHRELISEETAQVCAKDNLDQMSTADVPKRQR